MQNSSKKFNTSKAKYPQRTVAMTPIQSKIIMVQIKMKIKCPSSHKMYHMQGGRLLRYDIGHWHGIDIGIGIVLVFGIGIVLVSYGMVIGVVFGMVLVFGIVWYCYGYW